jgi:hypothetical protein
VNDLDISDFNKARSFLLGWSVLVFCLWFFGADLTAFKLLGNEIKLTKNVSEVWLLLGCVNIYLWFRYLQMVPDGGFNFDGAMNEVYDGVLRLWVTVRMMFYDRWQIKISQKRFNGSRVKVYRPEVAMKRHSLMVMGSPVPAHRLTLVERASMEVRYISQVTLVGGTTIDGDSFKKSIKPSGFLAVVLKLFAFSVGIFIVPWFANYLLPVLIGAGTAGLAISKWWLMKL